MDSSELHYLTYDPDEIMEAMLTAYADAGGDVLYAGDEKEMLLRGVLAVITQAFAGMDNALRMDTLRYAVREYLDIYGEKRGCVRIPAAAAAAVLELTCSATGVTRIIPAGTIFTADGVVLYQTDEDVTHMGYAQELTVPVTCTITGSAGNGLLAGTEVQPLAAIDGVELIVCTEGATGGQDEETDDAYRERIRTYGLASVTTGTQEQYEAVAKAVSSEIVDARALNLGAGSVGVYILPASDTGLQNLLDAVEEALNDRTARPLTDTVTVAAATPVSYTLNVQYSYEGSGSIQTAVADAVQEYEAWQEQTIGRAFNPDRLAALIYQAGASRVVWGAGSAFNGSSTIEYTEIQPNEYCAGDISIGTL